MVDLAGMVGDYMRSTTLLKANIRQQRASFIGVLILMMIVTCSLCAVMSVWHNANAYEKEEIERIQYGDVTTWMASAEHIEEAKQELLKQKDVASIGIQPAIFFQHMTISDMDMEGNVMILPYAPEEYDYHIFNETQDGWIKQGDLKKDEVYVPISAIALYETQIGDTLRLQIGSRIQEYRIKGFYEDPIMGSTVMGMKSFLVSDAAYQAIAKEVNEHPQENVIVSGMLHIVQAASSELSIAEFQKLINEESSYREEISYTYSKEAIMGFMMVLQNIYSGFLLLFVVVLLVVAMLVLGHSISSSIEQDYVNMGILKAVGFTQKDLRSLQITQYVLAIVIGMLIGLPLSLFVVNIVNQITLTSTGLLIPSTMPFALCLVALGIILILLVSFILFKTRRISSITPIKAIRGGKEDVYFKSRVTLPIYQKGLSVFLAIRQLSSSKKQYISACLVSALLVFFLSLMGRMSAWMGEDGQGLKDAFASASYDIGILCNDEQTHQEAERLINSYTPITESFYFRNMTGQLNHTDYIMNVISEPERYHILQGRTARYDNEIVITEIVAKEQGIAIGDSVTVGYGGKEAEYIITGINQSANDMGANFSMAQSGYHRLANGKDRFYTYYVLEDHAKVSEISKALTDTFHERIAIDDNVWAGLENSVAAMNAFEYLMYVIVIFFVLVVIILTGTKLLFKEQHDLGIYKSLGFSSSRLRISFALRFGMIAFLGSVIGSILSAWFTDPLAVGLLRFAGMSSFESHLDIIALFTPGVIVTLLFMMFAYIIAGKIKKVSPNILIGE